MKLVGARRCLILSQVGLLFPVNHAPNWKLASLAGFAPAISCMRSRRVGLDYTTGTARFAWMTNDQYDQ